MAGRGCNCESAPGSEEITKSSGIESEPSADGDNSVRMARAKHKRMGRKADRERETRGLAISLGVVINNHILRMVREVRVLSDHLQFADRRVCNLGTQAEPLRVQCGIVDSPIGLLIAVMHVELPEACNCQCAAHLRQQHTPGSRASGNRGEGSRGDSNNHASSSGGSSSDKASSGRGSRTEYVRTIRTNSSSSAGTQRTRSSCALQGDILWPSTPSN